jgi:hypothetical protein
MERKLPVLLARALVAPSTSKNDSADNVFQDQIRFAEPSVTDVANKTCEIHVTINIKVEKSKDLTISQSHFSRPKRVSSSESDDSHADDAPKKRSKEDDHSIVLSHTAFAEDQREYCSLDACPISANTAYDETTVGEICDNVVRDDLRERFGGEESSTGPTRQNMHLQRSFSYDC